MKHHLREEKTCLNCGAEVTERYCSRCGQENIVPEESFGSLVNHFFADITHYDTKFFITIKDLFFKPGFLTKEYTAGRRARYLNPVRMYVFISFVFFLVYFAINNRNDVAPDVTFIPNTSGQQIADSLRAIASADNKNNQAHDSIANNIAALHLQNVAAKFDTTRNNNNGALSFSIITRRYNSMHEYDSVQQSLPLNKKDDNVNHWIIRHLLNLHDRYGSRTAEVVLEKFRHNTPKMMFLLLPMFALLLKLFYKWKKYYYVDHAIFAIHFHSFAFLLLLVAAVFNWIFGISLEGWAAFIIFIYLLLALRNTYRQSYLLSFFKTIIITFFYTITIGICTALVALVTFLSV